MKPSPLARLAFGCLLTVLSVSVAAADPPAGPPEQIGSKATAAWTDSTEKAAATPEQKKVLASGKVATVTGELVEASCYLQLGKRGEAHVPCGSDCIKHGQTAGIVDKAGKLTLLFVASPWSSRSSLARRARNVVSGWPWYSRGDFAVWSRSRASVPYFTMPWL
jgi:hypothetical protein